MAFLEDDNKQQNQNGTPQTDQNGGQVGSSAPIQNSGGGIVSSAPTQTAGVGAGGSGWTNIQSYLDANKGNNASADYLNQQVGSQFDQESQNLHQQADQTKADSQKQVDSNNIGQDQASKMVSQAGNLYNYTGTQSQDYQNALNPLKSSLTSQYGGPTQFSYGMSADAQNYGSGLQNNFTGLMDSIYDKASGSHIGTGELALQHQLDQNNSTLDQTRQNLLSRYSGLNDDLTNTVNDTNNSLEGNQQAYITNQSNLKSYLQGLDSTDRSNLTNAANQFNTDEGAVAAQVPHNQLTQYFARDAVTGPQYYQMVHNGGGGNSVVSPTLGQVDPGWLSSRSVDASQFAHYTPAEKATIENIAGNDDSRNGANALSDILGSAHIGKTGDLTNHGTYSYDQGAENAYWQNVMKSLDPDRPGEFHEVSDPDQWRKEQAAKTGLDYTNRQFN